MSEKKFTEGEWKASGNGVHAGMRCVAIAFAPDQVGERGVTEQVKANAQLIAAAPDLYAVLSRILDYDDGPCHMGTREGYEWIGRAPDVWEAARTALKKARGEK